MTVRFWKNGGRDYVKSWDCREVVAMQQTCADGWAAGIEAKRA
jgi:hypothetical protein